jgi:hypothetical protein
VYRLAEFRKWIESNVLFPVVPDSIVKPLRAQLIDAENALVVQLYSEGEFERIAAIHKSLLRPTPCVG